MLENVNLEKPTQKINSTKTKNYLGIQKKKAHDLQREENWNIFRLFDSSA